MAQLSELPAPSPPPEATIDRKIAELVAEQSQRGVSSVVPFFLRPEENIGQLLRLRGIVRRAVRVRQDSKAQGDSASSDYYELDLFTADSQNLPVVCCVNQLPVAFPQGDSIREEVLIDGVFFKSWKYHSRKLTGPDGETNPQRQRYTPMILAQSPIWIQSAPVRSGWWGLLAGGGFLCLLLLAWLRFLSNSRQKSPRNAASEPIDFSNL